MNLDSTEWFVSRHLGPNDAERREMLKAIGVSSLDELIDQTVPASIRRRDPLRLPEPLTEAQLLDHLREVGTKNQVFRSYIGMGYYDCITPPVILRNVLENPSWYTPYTPYQAEMAQGRLEALLNFQTMVNDLTGMDVSNASLLDEPTAAAEAMTMLHRLEHRRVAKGAARFWVSERCFPQTIEVLRGRAEPLGIEIVLGDPLHPVFDGSIFGALLQYPDGHGEVRDLRPFIDAAHATGIMVAVATDLLSLALFTPPGEMGADIVFGSAQRFGVPMGYGGPHAAFFATREKNVREMPGRIIGVSVDRHGHPAYRMSLQTREQHIRREKAKSNICTAQALLATMASMYAVYHGPEGLKRMAARVHQLACILDQQLRALGYEQVNQAWFDTLKVKAGEHTERIRDLALKARVHFRYFEDGHIGISLDETSDTSALSDIVRVFGQVCNIERWNALASTRSERLEAKPLHLGRLARQSPFLTHPIFTRCHSELQMMRYIKSLERKDVGLNHSMIPLGSCTMKLNSAAEMIPVTWPCFGRMHPFAPTEQTIGYAQIIDELCGYLREITGFAAVSLQPNSGAQGEYAGLLAIRAWHHARGQKQRDVVLIPSSAHGTNPASAVMAGMTVVVVACDDRGNIDVSDLRAKAAGHAANLAALMVTYPSTHGVFEESIREITRVIHDHGGQVYMDGANLNAQVGLTSPALIGADVCHLNLHKTFAIPHGGGGPGMGPIAVAAHLTPFLPGHSAVGLEGIPAVSGAPWGSASILLISYAYIRLLGAEGCTEATRHAILNANYIKARLHGHYDALYTGPHGRVAHEAIFDLRPFKPSGVDETDVAKRLMDYGFHAPTVSWPVPGTMMIEPTESEDQGELDRLCDALISIRQEIQAIIEGRADAQNNVLKMAPHTAEETAGDEWNHPYPREQAAYPLPFVKASKFWPSVGRIDNTYGDRNLVCSCPPIAEYIQN